MSGFTWGLIAGVVGTLLTLTAAGGLALWCATHFDPDADRMR